MTKDEAQRLAQVLAPFAAVADRIDAAWTSGDIFRDGDQIRPRMRAGDFRRARDAWRELTKGGKRE